MYRPSSRDFGGSRDGRSSSGYRSGGGSSSSNRGTSNSSRGGSGSSSSRGGNSSYSSSSRGGSSSFSSSRGSNGGSRFSSSTGFGNRDQRPNVRDQQDITLTKPVWNKAQMKPFEKKFYNESNNLTSRNPNLLNDFLRVNNVSVAGSEFIKPILEFKDADLSNQFVDKFYSSGFKRPTPIQSMCWPTLLSGNDLVGVAQTGSGKTLGFIIPIIVHIMNNRHYIREMSANRDDAPGPVALVLAPTRELAIQIQQVSEEYERLSGIRNICIYGGASKGGQANQIRKGADIYIATPGRLLDFLKEGTVSLHRCTYLVLDEADRMLDMGFEPQIRKIIEQIRPDRQTAMFSATWPKEVRKLAEDFITQYIHITIGSAELTANPKITQHVEVMEEQNKEGRLREILGDIMRARDSKVIIFAETKRKVDMYSKLIRDMGHHCLSIHGDKKQQEREWVLGEFRKKMKSILCATDVAARGINVEDIKYVINIDYPMATEDYIHRIGRTARSSNTGTAYTFITRENGRHIPQLITVLREANQYVSDALQGLCRGGFRGGRGGGYQRGGNFSGNQGYGQQRNNGIPGGYGSHQNSTNGDNFSRKREAPNESNGYSESKRKRWDDGGSLPSNNSMRPSNGYSNGGRSNGHSNSHGHNQNGSSNGNKSAYGPPPPATNGHSLPQLPPPPPPPSSNGHQPTTQSNGASSVPSAAYGYSADYSAMYNMQYYQAMAAAAASSGQTWQAAASAGYPPVPPVKAP